MLMFIREGYEKTKSLWGMTAINNSKVENRCTIYRERPVFFHRRMWQTAFTSSCTETPEWNQVHFYIVNFLGKSDKSPIRWSFPLSCSLSLAAIAWPWSFCHVSVFSLSRSARGSSTLIFDRLAPCWWRNWRLAFGAWLLIELFQPLLLVEERLRALITLR